MPKSAPTSLQLVRRAAMAGDPSANCQMGDFHLDGNTLPYSPRRALRYYRKAAESGFADGQYKAACAIMDLSKRDPNELAEYTEAVDYAKKAALQGHAAARTALQTIWAVMNDTVGTNLRTDFKWASQGMDPVGASHLAADIFSFLHSLSRTSATEAAPAAKA